MKKAWNVIKTVLVWAVVVLAVAMTIFTVISATTFNRNDRQLFGYRAYVVTSDSMAATDFAAGDLIFTKQTDPTTLEEGDIITYISQNTDSFGQVITHKIRRATTDAAGNPGFITYGTTTGNDDTVVVTYPYILGKYQGSVPYVGSFFLFLKTTPGYLLCIFLPFMLLIIYQGVNFVRLFRRYKKEQMDQIQTEKDQLDAQREENARMLRELQELKAQLEAQAGAPAVAPPAEESDGQ